MEWACDDQDRPLLARLKVECLQARVAAALTETPVAFVIRITFEQAVVRRTIGVDIHEPSPVWCDAVLANCLALIRQLKQVARCPARDVDRANATAVEIDRPPMRNVEGAPMIEHADSGIAAPRSPPRVGRTRMCELELLGGPEVETVKLDRTFNRAVEDEVPTVLRQAWYVVVERVREAGGRRQLDGEPACFGSLHARE